jgi:ketosteroid isomerase-like protein
MAHDVFVSHSVKDKATAEKIVAKLEAEAVRCWVAPRDVVPGADWGESIIDAIESSRLMVLVFSAHANASSQIKREVERAVDKEVYTIPFRIDDIEPKKSLEYFISSSQWMDAFTPPLEQHLDKLARTVKTILAKPPETVAEMVRPAAPAPTTAPAPRVEVPAPVYHPSPQKPDWLKPAIIAAATAILVGAALWFSLTPKQPAGAIKGSSTPEEIGTQTTPASTPWKPPAALTGIAPATANEPGLNAANKSYEEMPQPLNGYNAPTNAANTANVRKGALPVDAIDATKEGPSAVVRRYYDSINRRDLAQAYDCFSQNFKARRSLAEFSKTFVSTRAIAIRQLQEDSRANTGAVVSVAFVETDDDNHSHEWDGKTTLVKEGDAWRIDGTQLKRQYEPVR